MEELLASQTKKFITLYRGQNIEGEVVSISEKEVTLDLGTKSEGILSVREIPKEKLDTIKLGDKLKAFVVISESESGQVVLSLTYQPKPSQAWSKQSVYQKGGRGINWQRFATSKNQKSKLSGKVLEINKGGLIVEVDSVRGFLPNSQVGFELLSKSSKGMEDLVGQNITVTVSEIDQNNNKLIFSQRGNVSETVKIGLSKFKKNQKTKGKIVAILPFGLVVNVEGVEGLVFISEVGWEKVEDLTKLYQIGEEIEVKVLGIDEDLGRLNLSIKQLSEDPFLKLADIYPADEVVKGTVVDISEAGVIFKLDPSDKVGITQVEGLLPKFKMDPSTSYEVGKSMSLLVDSVDLQRRRINLSPFITSTAGLIYK